MIRQRFLLIAGNVAEYLYVSLPGLDDVKNIETDIYLTAIFFKVGR